MYTGLKSPIKGKNTGSSVKLAEYLEKENKVKLENEKEYFFSQNKDKVNKWQVVYDIDKNGEGRGLEKNEQRFRAINIAPSEKELAFLGKDNEKLKEYTRAVMDNYARNFCNSKGENKELTKDDLVWYAKIEYQRKYTIKDIEVINGLAKVGELKQGDQRHIQIIVSTLNRENEQKNNIEIHPTEKNSKVFSMHNFFKENEKTFDKMYDYDREITESYLVNNALKNGTLKDYELAVKDFNDFKNERRLEKEIKIENEQKKDYGYGY